MGKNKIFNNNIANRKLLTKKTDVVYLFNINIKKILIKLINNIYN